MNNSRNVAIIPARGGSKGIVKKNIRLLGGKPLITHTIQAAKKSHNIQHIIVTTDDSEIAEIAISEGVMVIKRPPEISTYESPTIDAIFHVLTKCEELDIHPDIVLLLQPTSPLRTTEDIDAALTTFQQIPCDSLISVSQTPHPPYWDMTINEMYIKPIFDPEFLRKRRQDLPQAYVPNGAIYIASPDQLKRERSFYGERILPYIMPRERSIDIDSELDLILAELIMKKTSKFL